MELLLQKLFSLTGNGAHVHLLVCVQTSTTPTYTDEVKTGEQIMLLNRFWNEHSPAFFFLGIHCGLCFADEDDSESEDAGETTKSATEGEDQPPSKVRCMLISF